MNQYLPRVLFNKGFTLIELMVAIAIVAIISSIGIVLFSNTQNQARDARRKQDLAAIVAAIEGKRTPGAVAYSEVKASDFSAGAFPEDPKENATENAQHYCLLANTNTVPIAPPAVTASTQVNFSTCQASGLSPAPDKTNTINKSSIGFTDADKITSFTICAQLEAATTPNNFYCVTSK